LSLSGAVSWRPSQIPTYFTALKTLSLIEIGDEHNPFARTADIQQETIGAAKSE
jgi:hypothetical protein